MTRTVTQYYLSESCLIQSSSDLTNDFEKSKESLQCQVPKRLWLCSQSERKSSDFEKISTKLLQ